MEIRDTNVAAFLLTIEGLKLQSTRLEIKGKDSIVWFNITGKEEPEIKNLAKTFYTKTLVNMNEFFSKLNLLRDIIFHKHGIKPKYYRSD
jgi:hypothetical protein